MSEIIEELKKERQYVLKEINEKLSQIISELKELNELATLGGGFSKDLEEANLLISFFKQNLVTTEQTSTTQESKQRNKSSIIQIIEEPSSNSLEVVQESMDTTQ